MVSTAVFETARVENPAPIMISLLGSFRLVINEKQMPISSGSKSELLLTHLALTRQRRLERSHILEQLWPGSDISLAGQSLNSLIYQLNKLTKRFSKRSSLVTLDNGYYCLDVSEEIGVDIDYFDAWHAEGRRLLNQGEAEKGIEFYERALTLYRGDLGGDSSIQTIIERERLLSAFLGLLASLSDYVYSKNDYTKALSYIHYLLQHDPCREDAHRQAMRCYVRLGIRAQALRQYQLCCQILSAEFDTTPEPATQSLFNRIRVDPASI
jgi:DNA-binding SARP family transcriptional activator